MPGITNPAEAYFKDGTWGWDGSVWRKLPLVWGYSDRWSEAVDAAAVGAGDAEVSCTSPGAGYVFVLQVAMVAHDAGADKPLHLYLFDGAVSLDLLDEPTATSGRAYSWTGEILLKEGDVARARADAPGDAKKVYLRVWGYKMKIAE